MPPGQEANEERLRSLTDALGDLKIVGVRPKPPGLTDPNDPNLQLTVPIAALAPEPRLLPVAATAGSSPTRAT